jgi:hypothetical protein
MAEFPVSGGNRFEVAGIDGTNAKPKGMTTGNPAHTKGAYVEMLTATTFPAIGFYLLVFGHLGGKYDELIDVAVGAAGSEVNIISNLYYGNGDDTLTSGQRNMPLYFPLSIPAGTRISARCQGGKAASTYTGFRMYLVGGTLQQMPAQGVSVTYGADTSDSGGTLVDPGGSLHTKGAWTELAASTSYPIRWLYMTTGFRAIDRGGGSWLIDVGVGAVGSEVVIVPNQFVATYLNAGPIQPQWIGPMAVDIPANTRLAVRAQSNANDATQRLIDVSLIGVT